MYENLLDAIGNTPLVKIDLDTPAQIYAKLEYLNPGGSVKDRSARYMIEHAIKTGALKPGGTIIDASSGNQGITMAMMGALKGYRVIITASEKISTEKLQTMQAYGAEVIMCPATDTIDDPRSYHTVAKKLHKETPNSFMPDQYFNPLNAEGHYHSLGPEVWKQTNGTVKHFIAAAGTGGTISGTGKYLKEQNPHIRVIGVDSINSFRTTKGNPKPYKLEGIGIDFDSPVMNYNVIDDIIAVSDDNALNFLKTLATKHGILAGPSSGAVAYGAYTYAQQLTQNDVVVMIFGDSGRAYLTKNLYTNE